MLMEELKQLRQVLNPFYDIPTSEIRKYDPNFTYADR